MTGISNTDAHLSHSQTAIAAFTPPDSVQRTATSGQDCPNHASLDSVCPLRASRRKIQNPQHTFDEDVNPGGGENLAKNAGAGGLPSVEENGGTDCPLSSTALAVTAGAGQGQLPIHKDTSTDHAKTEPFEAQAPSIPLIGRQSLRPRSSAFGEGDYLEYKPVMQHQLNLAQITTSKTQTAMGQLPRKTEIRRSNRKPYRNRDRWTKTSKRRGAI
jgi:hypothetical protein